MTNAETRDETRNAIDISTETMAADLLAGLLNEIRTMPDHWARLNADNQNGIIDRLKEKIRATTERAVMIIARGNMAAVSAELYTVDCKKSIRVGLTIHPKSMHRHALMDAVGRPCIIVLQDIEQWFSRIDEIKAKSDQFDIFDEERNYNAETDQPGYRRDQHDRITPAGKHWSELKQDLKEGLKPKETQSSEPPKPENDPPTAGEEGLPADSDSEIAFGSITEGEETPASPELGPEVMYLYDKLTEAGCPISTDQLEMWDAPKIAATKEWVTCFLKSGKKCKIARPLWLPVPFKGTKPEGQPDE